MMTATEAAALLRFGQVQMPARLFDDLMGELHRRSENRREAGAFILGPVGSSIATSIAYYDDLDPDCLTGGITFHAVGFTALNKVCRSGSLHVLADIHLHPGAGVKQSRTDSGNAMVGIPGHLALIAPSYGRDVRSPRQLGAHVKTAHGWDSFFCAEVDALICIRRGWLTRLVEAAVSALNRIISRTRSVDDRDSAGTSTDNLSKVRP